MICLKLLGMTYDPYGSLPDTHPLAGLPSCMDWRRTFNTYAERGWLRSKICTALLETLEHVHWSETENDTVLDAENCPSSIYALPENTLLALVMVENSCRKIYTWLPANATQGQCADMAARIWPALQALEQPILVQGLYALHNDRGLFAAMESSNEVFEIRYKGRRFCGTYREMTPKLESTAYSAMRLLMAVNKGLAERPLPYPDEPLPFTPKCGNVPALAGWQFGSCLEAEPYIADGRTVLPCMPGSTANIICLYVTRRGGGCPVLEQYRTTALDYDDLLTKVIVDMKPGMHRRALLLACNLWDGWPEGAFLPEGDWEKIRWQCGLTPPDYGHEIATTFGFEVDGGTKTAILTEDTAALRMFRAALIDCLAAETAMNKVDPAAEHLGGNFPLLPDKADATIELSPT